MRDELQPPDLDGHPLIAILERAYERLDAGEAPAVVAPDVTREAGVTLSDDDLHGHHSSIDPDELAAILLLPPAHELRALQLTRDELIEVVEEWREAEGPGAEVWWRALFDANVPDPSFDLYEDDGDEPAGALVDRALAHRAIELGPADGA